MYLLGESESVSSSIASESRDVPARTEAPAVIVELSSSVISYYQAAIGPLKRCRTICERCSFDEVKENLRFLMTELKNFIKGEREAKGKAPEQEKYNTLKAKKTLRTIIDDAYGMNAFERAWTANKDATTGSKRKRRPYSLSKKDMETMGCKHAGSCYENKNCPNWVNKIQCIKKCPLGDLCRNHFLQKVTFPHVFNGKILITNHTHKSPYFFTL